MKKERKNSQRHYLYAMLLPTMLIVTALMLFVFIPHAYAELSKTKAQELAFQYCEDELGYPEDTIRVYHYNSNNEGWRFSFKVKEPDPTTNGLLIIDMDTKGNLTNAEPPMALSLFEQYMKAWRTAMRDYRTVYQFQQEWKPRMANLMPEDQAYFDRQPYGRSYMALMEHDISLPTEQDISHEEAVKKAEEAIMALPGWTEEMVSLLGIHAEIFHTPSGIDHPVYQFVFRLASSIGLSIHADSEVDYEYDFEALRKHDHEVFGDMFPCNVNVRIDARTGELVGGICVELPGNPIGDPVVFFLWEADRNEPVPTEGIGGAK